MFIDVAADIFGCKDNIRLECPPTVTSMPLSELLHRINAAFTRVLEQVLRQQRRPATATFVAEEVRLLVLDRSGGNDTARWVIISNCATLTPYCQLYVFQSRERSIHHGGDGQAPIPEARILRIPSASHRDVTPSRASRGSTTPNRRLSSSPRSHTSSQITQSSAPHSGDSDAILLRFLVSHGAPSSSPPRRDSGHPETCSAVVLSRLLNAVGVNLDQWSDPAFAFLASSGTTAARPQMLVTEYKKFCRAYPSLIKLMHRHLLERYGNGLHNVGAHELRRATPGFERRDWSPPRNGTSPPAATGSQPREESPRRQASPQRQHSVSARLSSGLASIPTAKDRKLRIYDP